MSRPHELRKLAAWYREFAKRTGNPLIRDARSRTADDLEAEADRLEKKTSAPRLGQQGTAHRKGLIDDAEDKGSRLHDRTRHTRRLGGLLGKYPSFTDRGAE
jgi:hypothetical protein